MVAQIKPSSLRFLLFLIATAFILSISFWLMQSDRFELNKGILAIGSSLDIVVLVPLAYYFAIRKTSISKLTVVPISVLCLVIAYQIIPTEHQSTLSYLELLLAPLELMIIGLLIINVRKVSKSVLKSGHSLSTFPEVLKEILISKGASSRLANIVTTEVSLFYYTFAGWKKPTLLQPDEFSNYKTSGYKSFFVLILFLLPVETFVLHFWLASYSEVLAWVLTGISLYSLFFIIGDRNAIYHRASSFSERYLSLKTGIRWKVELPYEQIENIELREGDETKEKFLNLSSFGHGNVVLILKKSIEIQGIYGIKKVTDRVVLSIDQPKEFATLLSAHTH